jgi:superfamily II DNA or RNA helicase
MPVNRFSSRREKLDKVFLSTRLRNAISYDRIAGYFSASLLEIVGEELDSVSGKIRVACNSDLQAKDIVSAKAALTAQWKSWAPASSNLFTDENDDFESTPLRENLNRLYELLISKKMEVRVLPDDAFGLIHGKAGVITLADGNKTSFMGSANDTVMAWKHNYELIWEDNSSEAIKWAQDEFDALWSHPKAYPLSDAVIKDIGRFAKRIVLPPEEWRKNPIPASAIVETPVYRRDLGLWQHQKFFVKKAFEDHIGPMKKARYVLADQVGLGKTIQLALTAQLIALVGDKPILILCPKTLIWQWQDELKELLDLPAAVWDGRRWIDENKIEHASLGSDGIRKCPRRVGIVSIGLVIMMTEVRELLLKMEYDCVILDEAHKARRQNLGASHDTENADPNNLMDFMLHISDKTKTLLLATATPVQLRPIEAYDLLAILAAGDESVLGNNNSPWRKQPDANLRIIMKQSPLPVDELKKWEFISNPLPPSGDMKSSSGRDITILRNSLKVSPKAYFLSGADYRNLSSSDSTRLRQMFTDFMDFQNPYIRRIIRRTREQLETSIDPQTNEPFLKKIGVRLFGEETSGSIFLPAYLEEAYNKAELFCSLVGKRQKNAGFLRTLVLRRLGSSLAAGINTGRKFLGEPPLVMLVEVEDETTEEDEETEAPIVELSEFAAGLVPEEKAALQAMLKSLEAYKDDDPKFKAVNRYLNDEGWLNFGCIIFSQYRDSLYGLAQYLSNLYPNERIALYSGNTTSGIVSNRTFHRSSREKIKKMVRDGEIRLLLGTDAASEGLNLQRLGTLINLDLPWNPTRLEQRKGRIQRIGQMRDEVYVYNMRYRGSVEDRVHELLSSRLNEIFDLFGQIPDVLEDVWVNTALGQIEAARQIIDQIPRQHPFQVKNTNVDPVDWESCSEVLNEFDKKRLLSQGWNG